MKLFENKILVKMSRLVLYYKRGSVMPLYRVLHKPENFFLDLHEVGTRDSTSKCMEIVKSSMTRQFLANMFLMDHPLKQILKLIHSLPIHPEEVAHMFVYLLEHYNFELADLAILYNWSTDRVGEKEIRNWIEYNIKERYFVSPKSSTSKHPKLTEHQIITVLKIDSTLVNMLI